MARRGARRDHLPRGGLDVEAVQKHLHEKGSILGFPGARDLPTAEGLELDCDVLIPAALESQITVENAPRIRARIVAEGANGPTTVRRRADPPRARRAA